MKLFYKVMLRWVIPLLAPFYRFYKKARPVIIRHEKYRGRVLYTGQCYYNAWYLSRELRKLGWRADVLNWDPNPDSQKYYHGQDYYLNYQTSLYGRAKQMFFYFTSLVRYDVFHFNNRYGISFGPTVDTTIDIIKLPKYSEIRLLKILGKKIVYTQNGCQDGISQSSYNLLPGKELVCDVCQWQNNPDFCSDERNLEWGKIRNSLADYVCQSFGNRSDYNNDSKVHEVPEFYCLDPEFWRPDLPVPPEHRLSYPPGTVKIYHAVGNFEMRTNSVTERNVKSTHIYVPLIERLKKEGYPVELIFAKNVPNKEVRFLQVQSDIVVDMLTMGFFGANVREAMMLGKPAVCYLRPEWLANIRREIPAYVDELPVINATPDTVYSVIIDLIQNPQKRLEVGEKSREFAVKWHSAKAGAIRLQQIYQDLFKRGNNG